MSTLLVVGYCQIADIDGFCGNGLAVDVGRCFTAVAEVENKGVPTKPLTGPPDGISPQIYNFFIFSLRNTLKLIRNFKFFNSLKS